MGGVRVRVIKVRINDIPTILLRENLILTRYIFTWDGIKVLIKNKTPDSFEVKRLTSLWRPYEFCVGSVNSYLVLGRLSYTITKKLGGSFALG